MSGLEIIFAGSGEFGAPTLRSLIESSNHSILRVISQPDRPSGRGRKLHPTPISQIALDKNLPLLRAENINALALPAADLLLVIAFGQKIAPHIVAHPRLGSINLHGSRLPRHRGAAPVNWTIISGDTVTGNSVIRLATRMDAGPVLAQSMLQIGELETAGELHDRLALDGVVLIRQTLDSLVCGEISERPQDDSQATLAPKLTRAHARIDWSLPGEKTARYIRGMFPWPGCHVRLLSSSGREIDRVMLVRARSIASAVDEAPGEIVNSGHVAAGDGLIEILELQPEGKRPMPLAAYRNGHAWETGMRLKSSVACEAP